LPKKIAKEKKNFGNFRHFHQENAPPKKKCPSWEVAVASSCTAFARPGSTERDANKHFHQNSNP